MASELQDYKLVDSIVECQDAVARLFDEDEIAMDIEGVSLSRAGEVCIIQMYAPSTSQVYLFDIAALKQTAFEEGGLKKLLEHERIIKIFFDLRGDNDALFHLHGINVRCAYDLQILYDVKFAHPLDEKLVGLKHVMTEFFKKTRIITPQQTRQLEELKEQGRKLFVPGHGGSYEVWKQRPMEPSLLTYAAADVKFLFDMKRHWSVFQDDEDMTRELDRIVRTLSMERLERFVALSSGAALDQESKKYRDFELPEAFRTSDITVVILEVPPTKKGLVIGKKGATIKGINSSSGAIASFDDRSDNVIVRGKPSQVRSAVKQIKRML